MAPRPSGAAWQSRELTAGVVSKTEMRQPSTSRSKRGVPTFRSGYGAARRVDQSLMPMEPLDSRVSVAVSTPAVSTSVS